MQDISKIYVKALFPILGTGRNNFFNNGLKTCTGNIHLSWQFSKPNIVLP